MVDEDLGGSGFHVVVRKTLAMAASRLYLQVGLAGDLEPKGFPVGMVWESSSLRRSSLWVGREGVLGLEGGAKIGRDGVLAMVAMFFVQEYSHSAWKPSGHSYILKQWSGISAWLFVPLRLSTDPCPERVLLYLRMRSSIVEVCKEERSFNRGIMIGGVIFEFTGGYLVQSMVVWELMEFWADVVMDFTTFLYNFSEVLLTLTCSLKGHMVQHGGDYWRGLSGV